MIFDTHAHLWDKRLREDLDSVFDSMKRRSVTEVLVPTVSLDEIDDILSLRRYPGLVIGVGIHPSEVKELPRVKELEAYLKEDKVVALGEIGLDYYWTKDNKPEQQELFYQQLVMAKKHALPVLIHDRDAHEDVRALLREVDSYETGIIMHAYSGSKEMALEDVRRGAYISLAGPVTFKNARVPKEVAMAVPLDHLLVETDSPYMTPHPFRGKRNDPSLVYFILEEIARLRGIAPDVVARQTTENAHRVLGL